MVELFEKAGEFFPVTYVCRGDFEDVGFDASHLTDVEMKRVAETIAEAMFESDLYWMILKEWGKDNNLPKVEKEEEVSKDDS